MYKIVQNLSISLLLSTIGVVFIPMNLQSSFGLQPGNEQVFCEPGQIAGPFGTCQDPTCQPGQILSEHYCVYPPCPHGMHYDIDLHSCISNKPPSPPPICPDGSIGERTGPGGIAIKCPLPLPNNNPTSGSSNNVTCKPHGSNGLLGCPVANKQ
jgi:hypothetical protein